MLTCQIKDILSFRYDLYFDGAVQADWFYDPKKAAKVASSYVFHGPKTHAVEKNQAGMNLIDTASFALKIAQKYGNTENGSPITLTIAGYGEGKSHLVVALSDLFSGEAYEPDVHKTILENIARADEDVAKEIKPLVKNRRIVLTLNGMRDFNLHYELLRTAEKTLSLYDSDVDILKTLNKAKETAVNFLHHSYSVLEDRFVSTAIAKGLHVNNDELKNYLINNIDSQNDPTAFDIVNDIYTEFNGHPIRLDEGVSASSVLDTLLQECCGLHGDYDGIVILFDEFGRYLEYVAANPTAAGDSALQQIFESVQNAEGDIQFVGFIQSDIKTYLQRVDKSSNISRYIDRYDAGEKVYLSSNLETIFANLLEHKSSDLFDRYITAKLDDNSDRWELLYNNINEWLPVRGIWKNWNEFEDIIIKKIYPLHPLSTYLLCNLTSWLQSRSSLTLLNEKIKAIENNEITEESDPPLIYPVELLQGAFFDELLNAEEQGRQRSQFCILLNDILRKFSTKFSNEETDLLYANLILRICRFKFKNRDELITAMGECSSLNAEQTKKALETLEVEYAVLSYDDRLCCFDFIADSVGANEFRSFVRSSLARKAFSPDFLKLNDIQEIADVVNPAETDFGSKHGIQTREWAFKQRIGYVGEFNKSTINDQVKEALGNTLPNIEKGQLTWLYVSKETNSSEIDEICRCLPEKETAPIVVFILDDAENKLRDAILEYRVLADMNEADRIRFQRFYAEAMGKARDKLTATFVQLKQERKYLTSDGIETSKKRLKAHLTDVFETVYPKALPFDLEGMNTRSATGTGYKNYFTIMRWMLIDRMNYTALKSQPTEVRNRVESLLGQNGMYSWQCLNENYKSVSPGNPSVSRVYNILEKMLNEKKYIPFDKICNQLIAPPFGMNEYSAFMLLCFFSTNLSYTTKLKIEDEFYNTESWAEQVLKDKRYDSKLFSKTRLILVDVAETVDRFRRIFQKIKTNTDIAKVLALQEELDKLKQEENVPEELESEEAVAVMRLSEGERLRSAYVDATFKIEEDLKASEKRHDPYGALQAAVEARKLMLSSLSNGMYRYSPEQKEEMSGYVAYAKKIAEAEFKDGWIQRQICKDYEHLNGWKHFIKKAIELFEVFDFNKEAAELKAQEESEDKRIRMIIEQEALMKSCAIYMASSEVKKGMTAKNLAALQEQGESYLKEFEKFEYQIDKRFVRQYEEIQGRVNEIKKAINDQKEAIQKLWDAIYDIQTFDDVRHVSLQIESMLSSGLTDKDREDLEEIDNFLREFIRDLKAFEECPDSWEAVNRKKEELTEKYTEDSEISLEHVIEEAFNRKVSVLDNLKNEWVRHYLEVEPESMTHQELGKWIEDTQPLPGYLDDEATVSYAQFKKRIDESLKEKRLAYIYFLFEQLSPSDRETCFRHIKSLM